MTAPHNHQESEISRILTKYHSPVYDDSGEDLVRYEQAKADLLALKRKWETEARIDELDTLPYSGVVTMNGNRLDVVRWQVIIERAGKLLASLPGSEEKE